MSAASGPACPMCFQPVQTSPFPCKQCGTPYHAGCWPGAGCVVAGCGRPPDRRAPLPAQAPRGFLAFWRRWSLIAYASTGVAMLLRTSGVHLLRRDTVEMLFMGCFMSLWAAAFCEAARDLRSGAAAPRQKAAESVAAITGGVLLIVVGMPFGVVGQIAMLIGGLLIFAALINGLAGVFTDREKLPAITFLLVLALGFYVAVDTPQPRTHSPIRSCYANQKTILGAVEMYNLDRNTKRTTLDGAFFMALKSGGYLQSVPNDPGEGPGTSGNYATTHAADDIRCRVHGSIQ